MDDHRHDLRELADEESGEPTRAWIEYADGRTTDMTLTRTGPTSWDARPAEPATVSEGDHLRVDRLGPGCSVAFQQVSMGAEAPTP